MNSSTQEGGETGRREESGGQGGMGDGGVNGEQ